MKELMIKTLNDVYNELINNKCKTTHIVSHSEYINEFTVSTFNTFIKKNNIPDDAVISTSVSDYYDDTYYATIYWNVEVPNSEDYKVKYTRTHFEGNAFDAMSIALLNNGYVSRNFPCNIQSKHAVYNWYMDKNWEELEHYYLIFFKKDNINKSIT